MIDVQDLRKSFGAVRAVDGVTFQARAGEVFGVLGPNGAGKTTTLRLLATTIRPDAGTATVHGHYVVHGHDIVRDPVRVRRDLGVLTAHIGSPGNISARNARLRRAPPRYAAARHPSA